MKKTRLNQVHREAGARLIEFAGWEMPVEYRGLIEDIGSQTKAGLFDVSHMGEIIVEGPEALVLFISHSQMMLELLPGQIQYSALTTPQGTFVDDLLAIAYQCLQIPAGS
jgi:aminomethyltransferase